MTGLIVLFIICIVLLFMGVICAMVLDEPIFYLSLVLIVPALSIIGYDTARDKQIQRDKQTCETVGGTVLLAKDGDIKVLIGEQDAMDLMTNSVEILIYDDFFCVIKKD